MTFHDLIETISRYISYCLKKFEESVRKGLACIKDFEV